MEVVMARYRSESGNMHDGVGIEGAAWWVKTFHEFDDPLSYDEAYYLSPPPQASSPS